MTFIFIFVVERELNHSLLYLDAIVLAGEINAFHLMRCGVLLFDLILPVYLVGVRQEWVFHFLLQFGQVGDDG